MLKSFSIVFLATSLFSFTIFAQDSESLTSLTVEATSQAENAPEAAREIMQSAMAKVAREQALEILGEKKFQKNKGLIERKIVAEASKFIPISNSRNVTQEPDKSFKGQVDLKISLSSLRKIIQATGLLTDSDENAVIIPFIVFRDAKNSFSWWQNSHDESKKNLNDISQLFDQSLSEDMFKNSFYVIKPNPLLAQMLPEIFHSENLKKEDYKNLASFFHSNLIARGEVLIKASSAMAIEINLKIYVMQSSNNREIAEVARTITIERANVPSVLKARLQSIFGDVSKDLSNQVLETWQRGTLGSNSILVSVKGLGSPKQVQDFKNELRKNLKEVKGLKERIFESGQVTFEMEYSANETSIAERLKTAKLDSFDFHFIDANEKVIKTEAISKLK
jgi:hypothetical protein